MILVVAIQCEQVLKVLDLIKDLLTSRALLMECAREMMRGAARVVVVIADVAAEIIVDHATALVRGRVVLLAERDDVRLKAVVAATAIDVGRLLALHLAAEEEVSHFESVSECIALKRTSLF